MLALLRNIRKFPKDMNSFKEQIDDIEKSKQELGKIIDDLTVSMSEKFLTQFNKINNEFKVCFADFFGGGNGEIVLEQPDNCLESPIEIKNSAAGKNQFGILICFQAEKSRLPLWRFFSVCLRLLRHHSVSMMRLRRHLMMLMLKDLQNICER